MNHQHIKIGSTDLTVSGFSTADGYGEATVLLAAHGKGISISLHTSPAQARVLAAALVASAAAADATAVQVAA